MEIGWNLQQMSDLFLESKKVKHDINRKHNYYDSLNE